MAFEPTKLIAKLFAPFKKVPYLPILIDEQMKLFTLFFRPKVFQQMIEVVQWLKELPNVQTKYHKYGGLEFRLHGKEISHIHGDGLTDVLLNRILAQEVIANSQAEEHHVIGNSGWISFQISNETTASELMGIIQKAYELRAKST